MKKSTLLLFIIIFLSGCYKDIDNGSSIQIKRGPKIIVDAELVGSVVDLEPQNESQYSIKIDNQFYVLDEDRIPSIQLNDAEKQGQFIEVYRDNALSGAMQVALLENQTNFIKVQPIEKFEQTGFNGSEGLSIQEEIHVEVTDLMLKNDAGDIYSETISSQTSYSSLREYNKQLISYAYNESSEKEVVNVSQSFHLSFLDNSGLDLSVGSGKITFDFMASATEKLYYFDKSTAEWLSIAQLIDGHNSVSFDRSGYFAIGEGRRALLLEGVVTKEETPVIFQNINLEGVRNTFTSSFGKFISFVPKEINLTTSLLNSCGDEHHDFINTIGDQDQENIELKVPLDDVLYIKNDFRLIDCAGEVSEASLIKLKYQDGQEELISNYTPEVAFVSVCDESFSIVPINEDFLESGPELSWNSSNAALKYLSSCDDFQDGFSFITIRNDKKLFDPFVLEIEENKIISRNEDSNFKLIIETDSKGLIAMDKINISIDDEGFGDSGYFISCENAADGCGIEFCEISHLKTEGDEWTRIYFSGTLWMQTKDPPQAGNFDVEGLILSKN